MNKPIKDTETGEALVKEPVPVVAETIRYTADAQERIARQRVLSAEFPDEPDMRPLSTGEMSVARRTPAAALEKALVMAEAMPNIGELFPDMPLVRDAIAFELAYGGVRDEARVMARRVDHAILRRKLKAVKLARGLYRVGKGYVTLDAGDSFKPHVTDMKNTLTRPRWRKSAPPADIVDVATATKK